jgi:flagella basal body P-ring formation protein FlgA
MNAINPIRFWTIPVVIVLALQGSTESTAATLIQLKDSVQVQASVVRLGDVAVVSDLNPETVKRLEGIIVSPAPTSRHRLQIQLATIRSALQARGINLAEIDFTGKSLVMVSSRQSVPSRPKRVSQQTTQWQKTRAQELLSQAVRQYLRGQALDIDAINLEIEINPKDILFVLSAAGRGFYVSGGTPPWNQPQRLLVQFLDRNEVPHHIDILTRISQMPLVVAVRYTIPREHVLRPADLYVSRSENTDGLLTEIEEAIGKETTRTIRTNELIHPGDIKTVPLVRSNDIVTVYSRRPGISVSRQFKSRSEGALNDTITLVALDGRQRILATVTGFHEAEVVGSNSSRVNRTQYGIGRIQFRPGLPVQSRFPRRQRYPTESFNSLPPVSTRPLSAPAGTEFWQRR